MCRSVCVAGSAKTLDMRKAHYVSRRRKAGPRKYVSDDDRA